MFTYSYRNLKEYTKNTRIPESYQLTESEFRQLFDVISEADNRNDGIFYALSLAYRAGFEAARQWKG